MKFPTNLSVKIARVIANKTGYKFTKQDYARLGVIIKRYGALTISKQVNALPIGPIKNPIGYIEKMAQNYVMNNRKPQDSSIILDILKDKNE